MPSLRPARSGTRLFLAYAASSLVPVVVLGAVLVRGNAQDAQERGLAQGRAQAAVVQEMAIAPALHGGDLSAGLPLDDLCDRVLGRLFLPDAQDDVAVLAVRVDG